MARIVNKRPGRGSAILIGALPFILLVILYLAGSSIRLASNPTDKLLPAPATLGSAIVRMASPDARTGHILLLDDTLTSLRRLAIGLGSATLIGLVLGIAIGLIPYVRATLSSFIAAVSMIPPMAILPILFIVFGLDEVSKIVLIILGVAPYLVRDLSMRVQEIPREQLIKAQTLGASTWQIIIRVVLPQVLPRLVDGVRLSLGPAWLFLIAAEAIAATEGLGYRVFLVRRYLSMEVILPYVTWITLLAIAMDYLLRKFVSRTFVWTEGRGDE
jgi:NitT/TauT family transport system permease protein